MFKKLLAVLLDQVSFTVQLIQSSSIFDSLLYQVTALQLTTKFTTEKN